jgi:hypothetical protein
MHDSALEKLYKRLENETCAAEIFVHVSPFEKLDANMDVKARADKFMKMFTPATDLLSGKKIHPPADMFSRLNITFLPTHPPASSKLYSKMAYLLEPLERARDLEVIEKARQGLTAGLGAATNKLTNILPVLKIAGIGVGVFVAAHALGGIATAYAADGNRVNARTRHAGVEGAKEVADYLVDWVAPIPDVTGTTQEIIKSRLHRGIEKLGAFFMQPQQRSIKSKTA